MGHEEQLVGIVLFFKPCLTFHLGDEFFHFTGHVGNINIKGVIGRIGNVGAKDLSLAIHAAFGSACLIFNDQSHGTSA